MINAKQTDYRTAQDLLGEWSVRLVEDTDERGMVSSVAVPGDVSARMRDKLRELGYEVSLAPDERDGEKTGDDWIYVRTDRVPLD